MSSTPITHWCYNCRKLVSTRGRNDICSSCGGGFVQAIVDMEGLIPRLIYSGQLPPGIPEPSNIGPTLGGGNYFVGPGAQEYIQEIATGEHGSPPTSKPLIHSMALIKISKKHVRSDTQHCAVCKEKFKLGCYARKTQCDHMYHPECIIPWLKHHSTCPVCRKEIQSKRDEDGGGSASNERGSSSGDSRRRPDQETRSRFSILRSFRSSRRC